MSGQLKKEKLLELYERMLLIRLAEESLVEPILSGDIRCPAHLYCGEEAIAVGVSEYLTNQDKVFGTHRSHGHFLAKGGSLKSLIAEVYCKSTGCSKGRGGSMHLIDHSVGFLGAAPIVGGTISLALGAALASHVNDDHCVTVAYFGDGATGEGVLYEALNMAALYKLPLVLVCENNFYSTHMPILEIRSSRSIANVAEPFGVRAIQADGNDIQAVLASARDAIDWARSGKGPVFIEYTTYRLRGHVGPDDNIQGTRTDIRPSSEIEEWRGRDPLIQTENRLRALGVVDEELRAIRDRLAAEVQSAHTAARHAEKPAPSELAHYVFSN